MVAAEASFTEGSWVLRWVPEADGMEGFTGLLHAMSPRTTAVVASRGSWWVFWP